MRISRIDQLEQYILEHKTASIDALCEEFEISKNALRRDLEILVAPSRESPHLPPLMYGSGISYSLTAEPLP